MPRLGGSIAATKDKRPLLKSRRDGELRIQPRLNPRINNGAGIRRLVDSG